MTKIKLPCGELLLALCFALLLPLASQAATDTETMQPEQKIVLSAQQYNNWKTQLTALEINLEQLSQNSKTDKEQIARLEQLLKTSSEAMNKANTSLTIAGKDYQNLKSNLQILTDQMELLDRTNKRLERQRNTWAVVAGSILVFSFANHVYNK